MLVRTASGVIGTTKLLGRIEASLVLPRQLLREEGWQLRIVKRNQRAFQITGLIWMVELTFAWLGRNRRLSKEVSLRSLITRAMSAFGTGQRWMSGSDAKEAVDEQGLSDGIIFGKGTVTLSRSGQMGC